MAKSDKQMRHWEHFSHEADVGIRGCGETIESAFAAAATAMTAVVCDPHAVTPSRPREIRCQAPEYELLLVDWLNALVYEMAVEHMLFSLFDVEIEGTSLRATAWGESVDPERHQPAVEVKGATYTALKVSRQSDGQWLAQCVLDV